MIQFNQQFIRDYLKPFIQEVLTDMSNCEQSGDQPYLEKVLNHIQLGSRDKQLFNQRYFLGGVQPANRPFTSEEDEPYRQYFLDELVSHVDMLSQLSGENGMREQLLPSAEEGRTFGGHQALTVNLNNLALKMSRNFEKKRVRAKLKEEGKATEDNLRKVANGEMKLVEMDGQEQVLTEQELTEIAREEPQKVIIAAVEPDLEKKVEAFPLDDIGAPEPQPSQPVTSTAEAVNKDFENAKIASMKQLLEESGLEVIGALTMEDGQVVGRVKDVHGQELLVSMDTNKPDYAPDKFTFTFTEVGPNGDMKGKEIPVSQNDLRNLFFEDDGRRKPAEKVFREHDARGQMAKEKYTPPPPPVAPPVHKPEEKPHGPEVPVTEGFQIPRQPVGVPGAREGVVSITEKPKTPVIPLITVQGKKTPVKVGVEQDLKETVEGARIRGPQLDTQKAAQESVMEKKKKLAERKELEEERRRRQVARGPVQQAAARPQPQKKKGNWLAKLAIGTGASGMGGIFYALFHTVTSS